MRRREFIALPLGFPLAAQLRVPLRFFTEAEARTVAAACERIFPGDASGPGANETGVVIYIDRQLAGPYGRDKFRYMAEPFEPSVPEHGYQGRESPCEVYRAGLAMLAGFAELTTEQQDEKLRSIEKSIFFQLLRTHTIEGMFCDPLHGGNANMAGWRMIAFPGPRMSYREDVDRHYGEAFRPAPASLEQIAGRPVKGWEEET